MSAGPCWPAATALRSTTASRAERRADYPLEGHLRRELNQAGARSLQVEHGPRVRFHFEIPATEVEALQVRLNNLSQGRILWDETDPARNDAADRDQTNDRGKSMDARK